MLRAFAFRLLITYFVFNLFRRPPPNQPGSQKAVLPATNLYANGAPMDLYVYLSENPTFDSFNDSNALFWYQPDIVYGDWAGGPNNDGSYSKEGIIHCDHVSYFWVVDQLFFHYHDYCRDNAHQDNLQSRHSSIV